MPFLASDFSCSSGYMMKGMDTHTLFLKVIRKPSRLNPHQD